jgi:uncharacterized protein YegP (UPF0339 family)
MLHGLYRRRIGRPTTDDEVRGYWVFLFGLLLGIVGILLFLPSESAQGASGLTMRELSIVLAAVGLAAMIGGFVIRLPLQSWANWAAYLGQLLCVVAAGWFMAVFPADWSVQTGSQPVIILYAGGLAVIALGGVLGPLLVGVTREDLDESEGRAKELGRELEQVRHQRDQLQDDLEEAKASGAADAERLQGELDSYRASQAQFELYEDRGEQFRWRLRHRNGNVIADSGEGYTRKHNAKKGLASVRRNALGASLLEIEPEPDEEPHEALEETPIIPEVADESQAEFQIYSDEGGGHRWRLVHDNGNILADSGEGYSSRRNVRNAVESVRSNADPASYLQFDPTSFEIYRDAAGEWRFRLVHKNGNILAAASEGYTRRRDAKRAVDSIRENVAVAGDRFDVYEDNRGEYRWRFRGANNEIVATSGEGYDDESEAEAAVERVQEYAPEADALDVGFAAFEVYRDEVDEWRWRLRHRNGNILADSGEGYTERTDAQDAIESVKRNSPGAGVIES